MDDCEVGDVWHRVIPPAKKTANICRKCSLINFDGPRILKERKNFLNPHPPPLPRVPQKPRSVNIYITVIFFPFSSFLWCFCSVFFVFLFSVRAFLTQMISPKEMTLHNLNSHAWIKRHIVKHRLDWIWETRTGFVKHGFVKHGFVKGGLSFFVKNDCLTVYLFISVCPFLILILLLYIIFILCYRFTFK